MTIKRDFNFSYFIVLISFCFNVHSYSADYHVGPAQPLATISEVPWATLNAGDRVYIHWQDLPYKEKWVINKKGTVDNPIEIIGVNGPEGQQPIIDGNDAITVVGVNYWNEDRSVIKIGGSGLPDNDRAEYIIIENLEIHSARPSLQFTNDSGELDNYTNNAASIHLEKGAYITIRNCTLHDSGNGLFISSSDGDTHDILIDGNYFYGNGLDGSAFQHNSYTAATDITFQYNRYGPLRDGADGNNLKDRSAGLVIKYNWIEGGSRLLDLVNAHGALVDLESYSTTHVFGNILIKPQAPGNSQILHYGGDTGSEDTYRKGDLFFYNNTVISTRDGFTTLLNMSTNEETVTVFNNVIYTSAAGNNFAMISNNGIFNMHHNWLKPGWQDCHCSPAGTVSDLGDNILGTDPLFVNFVGQNFRLLNSSLLIDAGAAIPVFLLTDYNVIDMYVEHQNKTVRYVDGTMDIGAFENDFGLGIEKKPTQLNFSLFPNPTKNSLTIVLADELDKAEIYNELGQLILTINTIKIDVSDLLPGFYYIVVTSKNGAVYSEKFLVSS